MAILRLRFHSNIGDKIRPPKIRYLYMHRSDVRIDRVHLWAGRRECEDLFALCSGLAAGPDRYHAGLE